MNAASNAPVKKQKKASSVYTMKLINTPRKEISGLFWLDKHAANVGIFFPSGRAESGLHL